MNPEMTEKLEPEAPAAKIQTDAPTTVLPPGWEHAVSPVDGKEYYYNAETGATSWTHPGEAGATAESQAITTLPSLGDMSGIMANRTVEDYGKDIEAAETEDVYQKMTDHDVTAPVYAHRCKSFIAMILFFPLGVIAMCESRAVVSKYNQGEYERARESSSRALFFSRIACVIGVIFWSYFAYCFFAGPAAPFTIDIPAEWVPDVDYQQMKDQVRDYFSSEEPAN